MIMINVIVKKWFDDVNGNTYHNVNYNADNNNYNSGMVYGYGTQYKVTFKDMFNKYNSELDINNYKINYIVYDVDAESELLKVDYFNQI